MAEGEFIGKKNLNAANGSSRGLGTDGSNFYLGDNSDAEVYVYDADWNYVRSFDTSAQTLNIQGTTADDTNVWCCEVTTDRVKKYLLDGTFVNDWDATAGSDLTAISDLDTDGNNIWATDDVSKKVYKFDMAGTFISSWAVNAEQTQIRGITINDEFIWVSGSGLHKVYKYLRDGTFVSKWDLAPGNDNDFGLLLGNDDVFYSTQLTESKIYMYEGLNPRANTIGEKELRTDWDATTASDPTKKIGHKQNLTAERGSLVPRRNKLGLSGV